MTGRLHVVGVGPGDPELLTLKAARRIAEARAVAYPVPVGREPLARAIAARHLGPETEEIAYPLPMAEDPAPGRAAYDAAAGRIAAVLETGGAVALLVEGDPLLYGSASALVDRLAGRFPVEVVPGIVSATATAARLALPLVRRADILSIVPATAPAHRLEGAVGAADALAILKVGRRFDAVRALLERAGRAEGAFLAVHATREEETILPLRDAPAGEKPYFSLVLAPARRAAP